MTNPSNPQIPAALADIAPDYAVPDQDYMLAASLDELCSLDREQAQRASGELLRVGLRIIPDAFAAQHTTVSAPQPATAATALPAAVSAPQHATAAPAQPVTASAPQHATAAPAQPATAAPAQPAGVPGSDPLRPTGILVSELRALAPSVRALRHITVRGCSVCAARENLHGKELGRLFRAAYESAKQMTVILPCAMPYIIIENGLALLEKNRTEHPETYAEAVTAAQIVGMQNRTAFYAKLLVN